jgi:ACS family glucarate transporter-like MFS transporter
VGDSTRTNFSLGEAGPRWRLTLLLMLVIAVGHFNRISITVAGAEQLIPHRGIDKKDMGWVYTAYLLVYTLCMTPGGWFIDRFGPKRALLVVLFGSAVFMSWTGLSGLLFSSVASVWVALLVTRSLMGLFNAPQHPAGARLVGNWIPPAGRDLVNGAVNFAACVGIACTYVVFGWMIDLLDWERASLLASGGTFVLVAIWWLVAADGPKDAASPPVDVSRQPRGSVKLLLRNRSLMFLTLAYALVGYFQYLFFYWAQYYFEQIRHVSKDTSRLYTSLLTLAMGVGMLVGGRLSDMLQRRSHHWRARAVIPVTGLIVSAVLVVPGILSEDPVVTLVCFVLAMGGVGAGEGAYWTLAVDLGRERGGTAAAILNTGGNAGGLLAPVVTPYLSDLVGWQAGFGVASVVCLLGAVCWWWIQPNEPAPESTADESMAKD